MTTYLIIINLIGFIICFIDKYKAKKNKYRITEIVLLLISFIGGCFGFFIGMILFHHKTKKIKFYILIPLFMIVWLVILQIIEKML